MILMYIIETGDISNPETEMDSSFSCTRENRKPIAVDICVREGSSKARTQVDELPSGRAPNLTVKPSTESPVWIEVLIA